MRDTTEAQRCDIAFLKPWSWDFPGSPVVKASPSDTEGESSIPGGLSLSLSLLCLTLLSLKIN